MKIAYFDCFAGISGDMILGALVDAGLEMEALRGELAKLGLNGFHLEAKKVKKCSLTGTKVEVVIDHHEHSHRHLSHILQIIKGSDLAPQVQQDCEAIFTHLAAAEAKVHGTSVEHVHFHEVGALDSIVDIVGSAIGLNRLGVDKIYCSPIHLGSGFVMAEHGKLPVPAPGTAELVKGVPTYSSEVEGELTTPTGAAIVTTLASEFGRMPLMRIERIGYGAGTKEFPTLPNLLRLMVGEKEEELEEDTISVLESNIDDMSPQFFEILYERLFAAGALDVYLTPIFMKKSRPAIKVTVLCPADKVNGCNRILFEETTTFGVRISQAMRKKLFREIKEVKTRYGTVRIKVGMMGDRMTDLCPEYEDCKALAKSLHLSVREVYQEAQRAAYEQLRA
ncbi:MAG: nickel pincer cofactor biosynthesis protein LarC [candidate division NC10 bacterium]|nr:nickel pincer cofactor biosynthesis protein LarC [candidate division NC10 bacterium]